MTVRFGADTSGLSAGINTAKNLLSQLGSGNFAGAAVTGLTLIAGAAIGIGVSSVKAAADFQQSMLKVSAYAGLSKSQMDDMSNSILSMASQLGQSPKAMADAIYPIISSGYSASQALDILQLSAKTAAASGANMSTVADALTTSLKSMHAPASQAGNYMDMINKIVSLGKGNVSDYAATIGKLSLAAGSAHVPFDQMGAALATLTTHGFPSVAQASTSLGNLFTQIGPKVDLVAQHAKKLGIAFDENKFKTLDLAGQLNYLQQVTGGNQGALLKLLGGSTLALKAFNALSGSSKDFTSNLNAMKNATGSTDAAFKTASGGFKASMDRMHASMEVLQVKLGTALLPMLTKLADAVTPIITKFASWVTNSNVVGNSLNGVGKFINFVQTAIQNMTPYFQIGFDLFQQIGGFLVDTFTPVWQTLVDVFNNDLVPTWNDLMSTIKPIIPTLQFIGAIIGGVIVGAIILAIGVIVGLIKAFASLLGTVMRVFAGVTQIVSGAIQIITGIISFFVDLFTGKWSKLGQDLGVVFHGLVTVVQGVWKTITSIFSGAIDFIKNLVGGFVSSVGNMISGIVNNLGNITSHIPGLPGHASGILNNPYGHFAVVGERGPEVMYIPQGASIFPNGAFPSSTGGAGSAGAPSGGDQHIYIELDGHTLAHVVGDRQAKQIRLRMGRRAA